MIKDTPVLMFQGVRDLLIRPEGTIRLFKQIAGEDKDLILMGKSQYLLFEQGQFDNNTMQDLVDWLDSHLDSKQSSEQAQ